MTWRVQLPQGNIRRVDLLMGARNVVAVWTKSDHIHFYDQRNGGNLGERVVEKLASTDRTQERWRTFVSGLKAPNDLLLPFVRLPGMSLFASEDGRLRLYQPSDHELSLEVSEKEAPLTLDDGIRIIAVDLDRALGLIALLSADGKLHIYQQRVRVGSYDTGLQLKGEFSPTLFVPQNGKRIIISDGQQVASFDATGKIQQRLELHYPPGLLAASPDGAYIVTTDAETGVVRVHSGDTLAPTHQRFAIDLAADARRINPAAGAQPATVTPNALAISNRGVLAFGLAGLLCVSTIHKMRAVPVSIV
ncbi:MAG: hypothetical protein SF123_25905 [Chloroflexota bacterium]|nr:hypothetical protein [Chloroflexota bacterium]